MVVREMVHDDQPALMNVSRTSSWRFIAVKPVGEAGNVLQPPVILKDQQPVHLVAFDALTRYASGNV